MAQARQSSFLEKAKVPRVANTITDRLSEELVIALVGPVGSGVTSSATYLTEILEQTFGYDVAPIIKLSSIIREEAPRVELVIPDPDGGQDVYIQAMQSAGNALREKFGSNYLAEKAIEKIVTFRRDAGGYDGNGLILPGRRAYIIDSIKNTEELEILRQVYGDTLCLIGIFAPDPIRKQRLVDTGVDESAVEKIVNRDQGEPLTFGQMTRKVFVESDFFVCNDKKVDELRRLIERFLQIIFDTGVHTPTQEESALQKADSMASNSACMSRQVGAAIVSIENELISVGCNDVPKFGGGLYNEDDQFTVDSELMSIVDRDNRCFKWGGNICHNETRRDSILDVIAKKISNSDYIKKNTKIEEIRKSLSGTEVDYIIEYSRSIHAEMEAILSVAREGRHSLVGSILYTTTYPCHNCARHIVASGIAKVVYVQPYAKSLATELHSDSVTELLNEKHKVIFRQYEGVAPRNYLKFFQPKSERKLNGRLSRPLPKSAIPVLRIPLDGPSEYEDKIIADLSHKEEDAAA